MNDHFENEKKHLFTRSNYLLDLDYLSRLEGQASEGNIEKFMSDRGKTFFKDVPDLIAICEKALRKSDFKGLLRRQVLDGPLPPA